MTTTPTPDDTEALVIALRDALDTCTCTPYPAGDGPEIDCPMHGRADYQADACVAAIAPTVARIVADKVTAAQAEGERRGEIKALRYCTDLYCEADKALIRGWADSMARTQS